MHNSAFSSETFIFRSYLTWHVCSIFIIILLSFWYSCTSINSLKIFPSFYLLTFDLMLCWPSSQLDEVIWFQHLIFNKSDDIKKPSTPLKKHIFLCNLGFFADIRISYNLQPFWCSRVNIFIARLLAFIFWVYCLKLVHVDVNFNDFGINLYFMMIFNEFCNRRQITGCRIPSGQITGVKFPVVKLGLELPVVKLLVVEFPVVKFLVVKL